LFAPGTRDRAGRYNLHHAVREHVHETLHRKAGLRRERITTYGVLEEWGPADLTRYREEGLAKLLAAGVRTVFLANHFKNNMNVHGVSNMCCTLDWKVADNVGEDRLRAFCDAAHAAGARVEMWANTAISTLAWASAQPESNASDAAAPLPQSELALEFKNDPHAYIRNPSGAIEADHYSPVFCCLNLRSRVVRDAWMRDWGRARRDIGLDGFFLDSSFNLSSDKFHWTYHHGARRHGGITDDEVTENPKVRPAGTPNSTIESQYHAHLDLVREMQAAGYHYSAEDRGVFGLSRTGGSGAQRMDSHPLWADTFCGFDPDSILKAGGNPDDVFFQALAYRMMWYLYWHPSNGELSWHSKPPFRSALDRPMPAQLDLFSIFNAVEADMRNRHILPGESGVVYTPAPGQALLWCFKPTRIRGEKGFAAAEVLSDSLRQLGGSFLLEPRRVYRLRGEWRLEETKATLSLSEEADLCAAGAWIPG
jgi:hypothetical protein